MALEKLHGLQGLRAVAAAWVVIEHYRLILYALFPAAEIVAPWVRSGFLGVEIFFILSGFIIAYNYAGRFASFSSKQYLRFIQLRFARVYPAHLITLAAAGVLVVGAALMGMQLETGGNYSPGSFLGNVFLLQAVPAVGSWNPPAWSISAEFLAYLVFPVLAIALAKIRTGRQGFLLAAAVAVAGTAGMMGLSVVNDSPTGGWMVLLRISVEFTIGALLFAGWRWLGDSRFSTRWEWAILGSVVAILMIVGAVGGEGSIALIAVPFIALLVIGCVGATGPLARVLASRVLQWGGEISYSVYMTHFLLLMVFGKVLPLESLANSGLLIRMAVFAACMAAVVAAGACCYYLVERPGREFVRRITEPKPKREVVPTR
ncbi:acyltransferase family protein [Labedella endophytica]|uniref:Acyltransferase n=1 Tax=Labedella endophytica TaxID=1523160 RepID=A0A433JTH0_9MICO|nr:acyltransferase [Labedella endophytica]RUR01224.1 acyltransferase [Labedella endophytica]